MLTLSWVILPGRIGARPIEHPCQLQLEMQINTLESTNLNAETMAAICKASQALSNIHPGLCVARVCSALSLLPPQTRLTLVPLLAL